jgi:single-stranded-DNA-specific exonuclease
MNINKVDTFHVWFLIAPRINAWWRIKTPYESLYALLYEWEKQQQYLALLDSLNEERKKLQEEAFKKAQEMINPQASILIAWSETFHEWIIGIVAGKLTEKLRRPSMIYYINKEKNIAVASLRWPEYFSVIDMIKSIDHLLIKYWWHQQAWWLTCSLENLENVIQSLEWYCNTKIKPEQFHKIIHVDTCLYGNERSYENQNHIEKLWPFGNGNEEPILKIETDKILKTETVGKKQNHIKIITESEKQVIEILFWWWKEKIDHANIHDWSSMIGKRKKDNYGKLYVDWIHCFHD